MNTSLADAIIITGQVKNHVGHLDVDVVLAPPFVWLYPMAEILSGGPKNIKLAAQNMWFTDSGAMTGEVSPLMLKNMVKYAILGHSERRANFSESNDLINDKVHAALRNKITPIVCVGELKKIEEGKATRGRPDSVSLKANIFTELKNAFREITRPQAAKVIIAYEPVWAIGTGDAATGAYAAAVIQKLRGVIEGLYGKNVADEIRILYGGSVTEENIKEFLYQPDIDGALVGGAALKAKEFIKICQEAGGRE